MKVFSPSSKQGKTSEKNTRYGTSLIDKLIVLSLLLILNSVSRVF